MLQRQEEPRKRHPRSGKQMAAGEKKDFLESGLVENLCEIAWRMP